MISLLITLTLLFVHHGETALEEITSILANIPEDGRLQFCALAMKRGLECVRYNVTTEDGYILGVYNIPGNRSKPVYILHGFVDSSDPFLEANMSMTAFLAKRDYDVWLGNMRGNKYSKNHVSLNPTDPQFWRFSFHEIGIYDVPATIDHILNITGQKKLEVITHSLGTSTMYVTCSSRPEYNEKIKVHISLAPIAFLEHFNLFVFSVLNLTQTDSLLTIIGQEEFLGNSSAVATLLRVFCTQDYLTYRICTDLIIFPLFGYDLPQLDENLFRVFIGHYPSGTSTKNAIHALQLVTRKKFSQYDYGTVENLRLYNSAEPPDYDLSKVSVNTTLVVGLNDRLSVPGDVKILKAKLPNVVDYHEIEYESWNHIDFLVGPYMPKYLFGYVLNILEQYY